MQKLGDEEPPKRKKSRKRSSKKYLDQSSRQDSQDGYGSDASRMSYTVSKPK